MKYFVILMAFCVSSPAVVTPGQNRDLKSARTGQAEQTLDRKPEIEKQDEVAKSIDPKKIKQEVQQAFNEWKEAYTDGDKRKFLLGFANIPDLTIRISGSEWIGFRNYWKAILDTEIPKTTYPFRSVRIIPIDEFAALVTYVRSSPAKDAKGTPLAYRGTLVYAKTYGGWKIIAWHSHAVEEPPATSQSRPN
ncbi:MAG TPA: nuclear transport factor 2 family protein [Acidobacteriota bacterium]